MKANKGLQPLTALVGATALGLTAVVGTSTAAFAAPQDFGNIDTDRSGSLTVHKFLHQTGSQTGDISQAPAAGDFSDPVAGVEFTVYPLLQDGTPVDLGVPENWNDLADLSAGAACTAPTGYTLGSPTEMPLTDAAGTATVTLPVGLYQVCETEAPANIVDRALPFVLTIPMPHENGWVYDAHAYPKNGEGVIEKTIEAQDGFGLGAVVRFPVTVPVPTMAQEWTGFGITDTLDSRLAPVAPEQMEVNLDGEALDTSLYTLTVDGQTITMDFTAAGVAWLNEGPGAHVGQEIEVVFAGAIVSVGNGVIENEAQFWPNNPDFDSSQRPPLPSNEVRTNWGDLEILKRAVGTTGAEGTLAGAEFEVYAAADPYAATCSDTEPAGDPISVDGQSLFTSNESGQIAIAGLFVSDSVNPAVDSEQRCYFVKETKAPAGYVLPADQYTPVAVQIGNVTTDNIQIENTQQDVPELPLTGAAGQVMLIIGGVAAMAIAGGLVLMRRHKANAAK